MLNMGPQSKIKSICVWIGYLYYICKCFVLHIPSVRCLSHERFRAVVRKLSIP